MTKSRRSDGPWRLRCVAQHYAWGRDAGDSEVASLLESSGCKVDASVPYAELWMGTHPSGPSVVDEDCGSGECTGMPLREAIVSEKKVSKVLGDISGDDLPFLLKVLSVKTALSIQSHPDKRLAEKLHARQPDVYKDPNHKPEMAVALSDFEALCGFCGEEELEEVFRNVPEIGACCGEKNIEVYLECSQERKRDCLKDVFTSLMTFDGEKAAKQVGEMVERLEKESNLRQLSPKEKLALRLHEQYPFDIGVMSSWMLNYVRLSPGQAIALDANEPHAYLSGEIVECMATSDNVIRAGLTPKYKDTTTLCSSLTYTQGKPNILSGDTVPEYDGKVKLYRPNFDEFEVWNVSLCDESVSLPEAEGPIIAFCQSGECTLTWNDNNEKDNIQITKGTILFIPANTPLKLNSESRVVLWAASVNSKGWA
jgi:mannose-6-phosphate isomerase